MRSAVPAIVGVMLSVWAAAPRAGQAGRGQASGVSCDRACLIGIADAYFAAMAAHDPSKAPMARNARFTEQAQVLAVGEGLWKTTTEAPTTFKIYVPDPVAGQIGAIVMLQDSGKPAELAVRLKVVNRQITEAEHLIARINNESSLANLRTPRHGLLATVPPGERLPREILLLFGRAYYDALEQSDGSAVPFADDCVRRENGMQTAGPRPAAVPGAGGRAAGGTAPNPGRAGAPGPAARGGGLPGADQVQLCGPQLDTRVMSYIESIDLRRVWIADPERGLVFGLSMFRHPMREKMMVPGPDGSAVERPMPFGGKPFDLPAAHIFKIQGNRIHDIEAMGFQMPLFSRNGWSDYLR
jgi:hypothetical protein